MVLMDKKHVIPSDPDVSPDVRTSISVRAWEAVLRGVPSALLVGGALASADAMAAPPPGQLLAAQCSQCHGTAGRAVAGFESIAGQPARDMYKQLLEMSQRRPEGIMDMQVRAYTPAQLRLIANYLSTLPPSVEEGLDD